MLQPRLPVVRALQASRCIHQSSRHLRPIEAQRKLENPPNANQQLKAKSLVGGMSDEQKGIHLRTYKPRTPGLRHLKRPINDHLYKGRAYLPLTLPRRGHHIGGRNRTGRITVRHRGAGHKRRIRIVDFERKEPGQHLVERIEHDPGRSAHIALVSRIEGDKKYYSYIVAAEGMRAGETIESFRAGIPERIIKELGGTLDAGMLSAKTTLRGNCLPLHMISPGTVVYNVGLWKDKGAQLCRSAGTFATVIGQHSVNTGSVKYVDVILKSGEVRRIQEDCCATIGVASNANFNRRSLGKAGRKRWLGIRPTVRGVAMNACDHAHGGGRGKSKGNRHPVSIWGQLVSLVILIARTQLTIRQTKGGFKTRKKSNVNQFVVSPRPRSADKKRVKVKKKKD